MFSYCEVSKGFGLWTIKTTNKPGLNKILKELKKSFKPCCVFCTLAFFKHEPLFKTTLLKLLSPFKLHDKPPYENVLGFSCEETWPLIKDYL